MEEWQEGWKEGRKEGIREGRDEETWEVSEYIPGWSTGALTIAGIWSSKKGYKYVSLYSQYFYVLYQECSSVTIRWTINLGGLW